MLDEHGFGHHGTRAAGTGEPGDRRQQMQKKDGQIAHRAILARSRHAHEMLTNLGIRHAHVHTVEEELRAVGEGHGQGDQSRRNALLATKVLLFH